MAQHSESRNNWKLRRFVAYSILAHLGGGIAWGVPSLIMRLAEQSRVAEEKSLAEHFRKEEVKAKEHVRQQRIEQTRKDVDAELRKEFDKLTANLATEHREELWKDVAEKSKPESTNFAEALGNPDTPEQDLRTLEAELRKAMIENLNETLNAATARELADRFVDEVESQVAPDLAQSMQNEIAKRVAQQMRDEANKLIAKQRDEAKKAQDKALAALKQAADKTKAANDATQQASDQLAKAQASQQKSDEQSGKTDAAAKQASDAAKTAAKNQTDAAGKQLDQATAKLGEADAKVGQASPKDSNLDATSTADIATADKAIEAAKAATAKAAAAVQAKSADAAAAVADAKAATEAAQAATSSAIASVSKQADRAAAASAAVRAAAESSLSASVEQELTDELTSTTLPRLAGKLQDAFKKQLDESGMSDDALAAQVGKEVQARLAKAVPAMAKSANATVDAQFGDLSSAADSAAAPKLGESSLDKALAEGLAGISKNAAKRVSDVAADASKDNSMVEKASQGAKAKASASANADSSSKTSDSAGASDAAATAQLRDTVGALARGMGNGRLGSASNASMGISGLRQSALSRSNQGGRGSKAARRNESLYQEVTGQIAGREAVQGERWAQQGVDGATSLAADLTGDQPAKVVGEALADAKIALSNDKPYAPSFKTLAFTSVPYFSGGFSIDGNLNKWESLPAIELKAEHGSDPAKQILKLAWSNAGLFLYCKISDPNRQLDKAETANFWESDSVELWIDAYNTKEKFRAKHVGQQFWLWPAGSASDATIIGGEVVTPSKGVYKYIPLRANQLERWATQTADGYVMEVRIPPNMIADADLAAGRILGFNAYVNTMGGTDWYWSAGDSVSTSVQPDTWGDLLLAGSDAKIEVLSGREDQTKRVMMVGEPLRLRVTDGDMDLNPTTRDKVMVTLKGGRNGQQLAVLEETGDNTSIFEGAVTTALALDEPVPAVLGVYEGERVDVIYVDQARANGAREAQLSTTVSFGSAVMAMSSAVKAPAP